MPVIQSAAPVVAPDAPVRLTPDTLYVIDSDVALLVLCSPDGPLKVAGEEGPLRIRGKFADGTGKVETRTYKGKFIYTVDVAEGKSGRCELLVIPKGVQDEKEVIRRLIDANSGPQPPPDPPPPPPDTDPLTRSIQAAFDADPAADKRERLRVFVLCMDDAAAMAADARYATAGQLEGAVRAVCLQRVGEGQLPGVGKVVGEYLSRTLPTGKDDPLTADARAKAAAGYKAVAAALKGVK